MTDALLISELFYSIQGESCRAGLPCCFIRLSGCNLRCSYCDTRYSWDEPGREMSIDQVLAWLEDFPGILVEITGGEPLLQQTVYPLMEQLLGKDHEVLLETGGSLSIEHVPCRTGVILDVKCPGSGMEDRNDWRNLDILETRRKSGSRDEVKFVLSSEDDFYWASRIVRQYRLTDFIPVLFSPVCKLLPPDSLAALILEQQLPVRLQLQLHSLIWPGMNRGI